MTDYDRDRGAYAPSGEAPLAFDPRQPAGRSPGRPPTTLIVSAGVLLVLVLALLFYYRSGVRRSGEPPMVGQPLSDIKQAPPASSQPTDEAAGLSIYKAEQGQAASSAPTFAPPPEQPQPRPTAPVASAPLAAAAPQPAPAPARTPAATQAVLRATPATPAPPEPAPAPAPPTPVPATTTATAAGSGLLVQIGAFSSPALADKGWNDVARLLPGQMVGRTKRVEQVAKGSDTLYRAYVGGFGTRAEAVAFCGDLKAAGHACFVK